MINYRFQMVRGFKRTISQIKRKRRRYKHSDRQKMNRNINCILNDKESEDTKTSRYSNSCYGINQPYHKKLNIKHRQTERDEKNERLGLRF